MYSLTTVSRSGYEHLLNYCNLIYPCSLTIKWYAAPVNSTHQAFMCCTVHVFPFPLSLFGVWICLSPTAAHSPHLQADVFLSSSSAVSLCRDNSQFDPPLYTTANLCSPGIKIVPLSLSSPSLSLLNMSSHSVCTWEKPAGRELYNREKIL
jgi:hypothetical protein